MARIIDISHHQPPSKINYDILAKEVDFVIIRTQYGSSTLDRHYKTHHREFQKRGIPTAAYAWLRGKNIADMEKEATDFYNRTKEFNPTFWFLDVEEKSMSNMRAGTSAYMKKLRDLGAQKVGIYIAHHLYDDFNLNLGEADAVWIPHYGKNNGKVTSSPKYKCDIHQYTDKGRLNGYNYYLDLNRIISDKPLEFFTGGQATTQPPKEQVVTTPKPTPQVGTPGKPKANLKVDGYLGPNTISALQRYFGTPVDGVISQPSLVVMAMQKWLGVKADGYLGPKTISALQKRLGTPVDGVISEPSLMVKELQRRLNKGKL